MPAPRHALETRTPRRRVEGVGHSMQETGATRVFYSDGNGRDSEAAPRHTLGAGRETEGVPRVTAVERNGADAESATRRSVVVDGRADAAAADGDVLELGQELRAAAE